ncbi:MAG TPA: LPS export ABC transporter periplasmic protein LptC [Pyrinomonadaceae bacterium]
MRRKRATMIGWRTQLPVVGRVLAMAVLVAGIVFVGVSYYRHRNNKPFRLRGEAAQLSTEVVGVIENYERRVTKGDRLHILLRASREVRFSDGHHELENVHLEVYPDVGDHPDKITSQRTITNEDNSLISFNGDVNIETRDHLKAKTETLNYSVNTESGEATTPIVFERENVRGRADAATVDAKNKRLEMRGNVEITVEPNAKSNGETQTVKLNPRNRPVTVKSAQANFDQATHHLSFTGGATAVQDADVMSADTLAATLNEQKKIQKLDARGNSYLRSMDEGRAAEIFSADMDFFFDKDQQLERADARTNVRAKTLDADSEMQLNSAGEVNVSFMAQGERSLLREIRAGGRPVVVLAAPKSKAADPAASNKRLTADEVKLFWRATGRDLERAEAAGNAELFVEPLHQTPAADRKTLTAPRFDGDFYESGNHAKLFTATGGAKAVIDPVLPNPARGTRTLTSQKMVAAFARETQAVERIDAQSDARFTERERTLTSHNMTATFTGAEKQFEKVEAQGDVKFNERDRNAQAATAVYTSADEVVRLRRGEPVVWDGRARMKANEIDSDSRSQISYGRGKTTTTYYSQEQTGGATPFSKVKSPVFIAGDTAEIRHESGLGIYTGNARAWQDDNFVKADRITLRRETRRMEGEGNVESALYQARRKEPNGSRVVVPAFATSHRMFFSDNERLLHYEGNVDIKQGTERITSEVADVYLQKETYEAERTIAQRNVVITQPGKRGTGDWAQYTTADESVVLKGAPARVVDVEQGSSESRRLTIYLRENRVVSDGGESNQSSGRVRSTHKVKKQ